MLQVLKSSKGLQNNCYIRYSNTLKYNVRSLSCYCIYFYSTNNNNINKDILNKLPYQSTYKY